MTEAELQAMGYNVKKVFDYTNFSHTNHVNVIDEQSFQKLTHDTFSTIADVMRNTYGPYGSTIMISDQNETTTTKDGYNIFCAMGFNHQYKKMVYLAIKNIIERVNRTVGDGTTSCILLAEKVFNKLLPLMSTAENKRHLKEVLDSIELELQESNAIERDMKTGMILPMTRTALYNLLRVASNYDLKLVDMMMEALMPEVDENDNVTSTRNIIVDSSSTYESVSNANYEIKHLPGDYRVRVNMDIDFALAMDKPKDFKVLVYDHTFGASEWTNFFENYDKVTPVMIFARTFSRTFMDNEYTRYLKQTQLTKTPVMVYLTEVKGNYIQDELHDLAAVIGTDIRDVHMLQVDHETLATATLEVYNYNCMCVHNAIVPNDYIEKLKIERDNETSYVRQTLINDRIKALSLAQKDTLIRVKAGTNLELKMITDKIDDCVSITKSAVDHGIVPNMLWYACDRISGISVDTGYEYGDDKDSINRYKLKLNVCRAIESSIEELCEDIWKSKHGDEMHEEFEALQKKFYASEKPKYSFNVISDKLDDVYDLPTSSQYDLEVIVATLSIVKYLLTSRALIFDAFLLQPQGDQGHFVRED